MTAVRDGNIGSTRVVADSKRRRFGVAFGRLMVAGLAAVSITAVSGTIPGIGLKALAYAGTVGAHDTLYHAGAIPARGLVDCNSFDTSSREIKVFEPTIYAVNADSNYQEGQHVAWRAHLFKWDGSWVDVDASNWESTWDALGYYAFDTVPAVFSKWVDFSSHGAGYYKIAYEFAWFDAPVKYFGEQFVSGAPTHNGMTGYDYLWKNDSYQYEAPMTWYTNPPTTQGWCYMWS